MYLERSNNLNFHILLIFSLIIHIFALILLPGIREREILKNEEIKKIKAGLVVLKDDTKKKAVTTKKKISQKKEVKKQITKVKKAPLVAKKVEPKKVIKKAEPKKEAVKVETPKKVEQKKVIKKPVLSSIKRKSTKTLKTTPVLTVKRTDIDISRTVLKTTDFPIESNNLNNVDDIASDRKIVGYETKNLQEVREVSDIREFDIQTEKREIKLIKPVETITDTRTLDDNIEVENIVDLGGVDTEIALPKNIVSQIIEGSGTVEWPDSNKLPDYPEEAERNAWNGKVSVILEVIDGRTNYTHIDQKSAYPSIDRAVEKAAREWKIFIKSDVGLLVDGKVRITVKFDFE